MAATLKLKETSGSTLWDCLDTTGATNPGNVACNIRHLGWASREPQVTLIESETRDGGWMGRSRQGLKQSTHVLHLSADSKDNLLQGYNALAGYLADGRGKYWEYKLNSASDTEYLDFTHGWLEGFPRDEESSFWIEVDTKDVALPLTIVHQPWSRLDEIDAALNKLTNATLGNQGATAGRPNDWTWSSTADITAESLANGYYNFTVATTASRDFSQIWSGAVPGDIFTGSFEACTDDATNGRVVARVRFWDATSVLATHMSADTIPSTDPDNSTIVFKTTTAAPAGTTRAEMVLRSSNLTADPIVHSWRNANLSRTTTVPVFRSGVETISNDPASTTSGRRARAFLGWIESDAPVHARLRVESTVGDWGSNSVWPALRVAALTSDHPADVVQWINAHRYIQAEDGTAGTNTTATASANASGGSVLRTTFATNNNLDVTRVSFVDTTSLDGLKGKLLVLPRVQPTVSDGSTFSLRMSWGFDSNLTHLGPIVPWSPDESTWEPRLGQIVIPEDADISALRLAFYARRDSGTSDLDWDFHSFVPPVTTWFDTTLNVGEVLQTDPAIPTSHVFNTSDQLMSYAKIASGTTPFVLPPGPVAIVVADEYSTGFTGLATVRLVYEPTRHA